jgi:hypothetical protein
MLGMFVWTVSAWLQAVMNFPLRNLKELLHQLASTFPPHPALDVLVTEEANVLGRRTGLWSTETKMWGIVPKAAWHWGGDNCVANKAFGAPGSTPWYVCLPPAWGSADGD